MPLTPSVIKVHLIKMDYLTLELGVFELLKIIFISL